MTTTLLPGRPAASFVTTYRPAVVEDIPAMTALLEAAGLPTRDIEPFIDGFIVAEAGERIVACGGIEVHRDTAVLRSFAVDESMRGTGIGRRLSMKLVAAAAMRGCEDIYLFTADAWRFWQSVGFYEITLDEWRKPARRSWQWQYVSSHLEFFEKYGLRTMWLPA